MGIDALLRTRRDPTRAAKDPKWSMRLLNTAVYLEDEAWKLRNEAETAMFDYIRQQAADDGFCIDPQSDLGKDILGTISVEIWYEPLDLDNVQWRAIEECFRQASLGEGIWTGNDDWVDFWRRMVNKSVAGPTLFNLRKISTPERRLLQVPRYLFRALPKQRLEDDHGDICAWTQPNTAQTFERREFFDLSAHDALDMLEGHLNSHSQAPSILCSWTSSLPFAIQAARYWSRDKGPMMICAVDTRKFPRGQFVRDIHLVQTVTQNLPFRDLPDKFIRILDFPDERYDNGEYFSQGRLNVGRRGYVMSLDGLRSAGMEELYPELWVEGGDATWNKRASTLRRVHWDSECITSRRQLSLASEVARNCFLGLKETDIAILLLAIRSRTLNGTFEADDVGSLSMRMYGPAEVRRYISIANEWEALHEQAKQRTWQTPQDTMARLDAIFRTH